MQPNITLYHYYRSSCSWRVRWALALKKIPYHSVKINLLAGEHLNEAYLAKNPAGYVPALEYQGQMFGESLAILEWLEERFPNPSLLPSDPESRLVCRQLAQTIVSGTQPLQNLVVLKTYYPDEATRGTGAAYWIRRGLLIYETLLQKRPSGSYSLGGEITIADLCLIPQVYNAYRFGVDMAELPLCDGIYQRCRALPECVSSSPEATV